MRAMLIVQLNEQEEERLHRPVIGRGGFQNLLRHIDARRVGKIVVLTDPMWIERFFRYQRQYGPGGFERRMGRV